MDCRKARLFGESRRFILPITTRRVSFEVAQYKPEAQASERIFLRISGSLACASGLYWNASLFFIFTCFIKTFHIANHNPKRNRGTGAHLAYASG